MICLNTIDLLTAITTKLGVSQLERTRTNALKNLAYYEVVHARITPCDFMCTNKVHSVFKTIEYIADFYSKRDFEVHIHIEPLAELSVKFQGYLDLLANKFILKSKEELNDENRRYRQTLITA